MVVAQTFVPLPVFGEAFMRARDAWALSLHDAFTDTLYQRMYAGADIPAVRDETASHFPWAIPDYDSVRGADRVQDIDGTVLDAEPFAALRTRILERAGRAELVDEEDDDNGG